ncbi:MAG: DUF167 domain-containing protein [Candidatus Wolfebacteria bacterium]|nr:DUF167 domain-containing protein [Candidatus Wolfebacteria bacterium]MDP2704007.1 DUF167 domain-containing protein [bacterium]
MNIVVRVKPKAKKEYVKKMSETDFEVAVHEPPEKGKANMAVLKKLSEHLQVPVASMTIVRGQTSKIKIIKVETS